MGYTNKTSEERRKSANVKTVLIILSVLALLGLSAGCAYGTKEEVTFTINKSERVTTGSGDSLSSKYLIFTENEVFENSDTLWYMKWNSSDLYAKMVEGKRYKAEVYGFRIPFISSYRNIISLREVVVE